MKARAFPPFELQGSRAPLVSLADDIAGYAVVKVGAAPFAVWLRGRSGNVSYVSVAQRDLEFKFEVFTLGIMTMEELQVQWRNWRPAPVPEDAPLLLRQMMTTRPAMPAPPDTFDPWPFRLWQTEVVRRTEFIAESGSAGATFGDNPNMQAAFRPTEPLPAAAAACEVAAGVLFTGSTGERLLLGVDWMPMKMIVTRDDAIIDQYLSQCEHVKLSAYLDRRAITDADAPPPR